MEYLEEYVPIHKLKSLEKKVSRTNKKAKTFGVDEIELTIDKNSIKHRRVQFMGISALVETVKVAISGPVVKIGNWEMAAHIDHHSHSKNLVLTIGNQEIPGHYRDWDGSCEHCNKIRRRNDTYVLKNEKDEFQAVGRNCLQDFLGHDPQFMIWIAKQITFSSLFEENEEKIPKEAIRFPLNKVLEKTNAVIRECGWLSKGRARAEERFFEATADIVEREFLDIKPSFKTDKEDENVAKNVIKWVAELSGKSDYEYNLKVALEDDYVSLASMGIVCSAVAMYRFHLEKQQEKKAENTQTDWVGEIGKRQLFDVILISKKYIEGRFGTTTLHRFSDNQGNLIIWFGSNDRMEEGKEYKIKATVKKHDEYRGKKQTVVNRASLQ